MFTYSDDFRMSLMMYSLQQRSRIIVRTNTRGAIINRLESGWCIGTSNCGTGVTFQSQASFSQLSLIPNCFHTTNEAISWKCEQRNVASTPLVVPVKHTSSTVLYFPVRVWQRFSVIYVRYELPRFLFRHSKHYGRTLASEFIPISSASFYDFLSLASCNWSKKSSWGKFLWINGETEHMTDRKLCPVVNNLF